MMDEYNKKYDGIGYGDEEINSEREDSEEEADAPDNTEEPPVSSDLSDLSDFSASSKRPIPAGVKQRMPVYYRFLRTLVASDQIRISSKALARLMGITPSLLRQDLCHFGGFGQQGYGYNVKQLYNAIGDALGVNDTYTAVIVGSGPLAEAVTFMPIFIRHGVKLVQRFRYVEPFREYCENPDREEPIADIAVLVLEDPYNAAHVAEHAGFKAIVNYSDRDLEANVFPTLKIINTSLADPMMAACCTLKHE